MNRRDFFKKSSIALSTIAIAGGAAGKLNKLIAAEPEKEHFTFSIITDKPVKAIKLAEEFFRANYLENLPVKFSQSVVTDELYGDLVFVHKGKLVNYRRGNARINTNLREIANSLGLPKKVSNPTRIRFYTADERYPAKQFLIYHKGVLSKTISSEGDTFNINMHGSKGNVVLGFENNKVSIVRSSCAHKNCVSAGSISLSGESLVCIPNEILILAE